MSVWCLFGWFLLDAGLVCVWCQFLCFTSFTTLLHFCFCFCFFSPCVQLLFVLVESEWLLFVISWTQVSFCLLTVERLSLLLDRCSIWVFFESGYLCCLSFFGIRCRVLVLTPRCSSLMQTISPFTSAYRSPAATGANAAGGTRPSRVMTSRISSGARTVITHAMSATSRRTPSATIWSKRSTAFTHLKSAALVRGLLYVIQYIMSKGDKLEDLLTLESACRIIINILFQLLTNESFTLCWAPNEP